MNGGWHNVELGDVLRYTQPTKFIVESTDYSDEFEVPVLTAGKSFILGHTDEKEGLYVDLPTIIFDDFTTSFHFVDFPFKVKSSAMKMLNLSDDACDIKFLYYLMRTIRFDPDQHKRYWISKFSKFRVAVPPLDEQKRIAGILDEADRVRKKTQALIDKYDELAQSLFLDMFGDPVTNPKGWEVKPLQDLLVQKPDNGFFAKKDKYGPEGVPVVWLSDFIDRTYVSQKELKRAQVEPKDKKYELEYGDALFCRSSLTVEGIGKCSIVPKTMNEPTIFECHIIRLKLNLGELVPEYLRFLTDTTFFRQQVMRNAKTSTMTTIAQDGISQIAIPLPPLSVQEDFCRRVTLMQHQKQLVEDAIDEGHLVFNSLLQKAFKGELT